MDREPQAPAVAQTVEKGTCNKHPGLMGIGRLGTAVVQWLVGHLHPATEVSHVPPAWTRPREAELERCRGWTEDGKNTDGAGETTFMHEP